MFILHELTTTSGRSQGLPGLICHASRTCFDRECHTLTHCQVSWLKVCHSLQVDAPAIPYILMPLNDVVSISLAQLGRT
jgi:hypothetical protein